MKSNEQIQKAAQKSLQMALSNSITLKSGYVRHPQENLLPDIRMDYFEDDLRQGDGSELRMKFCAAHSSTALAINSFAWFHGNDNLRHLLLLGKKEAKVLKFERKCTIFKGGRAPNLDVWVEYPDEVIAIESKLTEYFKKTTPEFSNVYERLGPPDRSEQCWWDLYLKHKAGVKSHLDYAQLLKHYFGLRSYQLNKGSQEKVTFMYLFWEPTNADQIEECLTHRQELADFKKAVEGSQVEFQWMTYDQLWAEWLQVPEVVAHVCNLQSRYQVKLPLR